MSKIVNFETLLGLVARARESGKTIAHCHGCFDIVHPGHVRYLEFARRQADLLVVSLTGDAQINKGDQRPYIPQELRAENLAALQAVDLVYINPHPTACELLAELRPDLYVKGGEYERSTDPGFLAERQAVDNYGGKVVFSSGDVVFSSTRLLESISPDAGLEQERLALLCKRYGIDVPAMHETIGRFRGLRVLVVGDLIMDRYVFCDATELASEAPMMSLTRLEERGYVGGAGIVARHMAGLGATTFLLSAVADDEATRRAAEVFASESVAAHLPPCRERLPEKTRYLVDNTKVMRVEDALFSPLDSVTEEKAAAWVAEVAPELDAVVFCDFGYGTVTAGLLERLRRILDARPVTTTANAGGRRARLLQFKHATLLCPTERELRLAQHDFDRGLSSVAWNAMDLTQAAQMLVTLGKKGLVAFDRQTRDVHSPEWRGRLRSEYLPALADRVVDPLGCGDALLATATLTLASGGTLMQSAYMGSAAAAISAHRLGNLPVDSETLRRWLAGRLELSQSAGAATARPSLVNDLVNT